MTISGPTTAIAGERLVLTCTVRVVEYLISVPSVEWSGGSVGRGDDVIESNTTHDGVVIVSENTDVQPCSYFPWSSVHLYG